jgi:hypothetical protein
LAFKKIKLFDLIKTGFRIFTIILVVFINGCNKEDNNANDPKILPEGDIILDVLFADAEEFKYIHPGYSAGVGSGAPWGFEHLGLDFITATNGAKVLAPAGGVVEEVNIYMNPRNNQWQVNVRVKYNEDFIYHILFEPRAPSEDEIALQRAAIPISVGQKVAEGELLGKILDLSHGDLSGGEAGIHFDLRKNEELVCPGNYFTLDALEEMLALLWAMYPQAKICYP